ncbi:MMPL family transporter [Nocardioides sp. HDW12B]|uniref:MMPL family transporter n=1 Tax=Nocardioides sp. HDW12B TaxID=2714939 RepID=UPI00140E84DB|nr:MMPL family transporter [Nocardioides sp. HDW12B]QIK67576.1 MMPL family transporter [Nocardioides sp. HDW12B]
MNRLLYRSGHAAAAHPWRALLVWLTLLGALLGAAADWGGTTQENWDVPGARAQVGTDLLREHVPGAGNAYARVVVHDDGPLEAGALEALGSRLSELDHVATVAPPRLSDDRDTAVVDVGYDVPVTHPDLFEDVAPLEEAAEPLRDTGVQVELSGGLPDTAAAPMKGYGELIGIVAALVILVLTFGSVVAAGLPVAIAVGGLVGASGGLALLAAVMDVSPSAPMVATMVGLGVGIDYALLMAVRHAENLRAGHDVVTSAALASATAGRAVVFAAGTVLVSLLGLRLANLPTYSAFGFATAIAVLCVLVSALVLVPALCRLAGRRLLPRGDRRQKVRTTEPATARWARKVSRRPAAWAVGATLLMLLLALPTLDMRTWPHDAGSQPEELTTRQAFDLVTEEFGPGATTNMVVVADLSAVPRAALDDALGDVRATDGVVAVSEPRVSPDGEVAVADVVPGYGATDERIPGLVDSLRDVLPEGAELTGDLPFFADISAMLADRLLVVVLFVVGVSVVLLMMMFRSVVVPVKAALMNLLSVSAAYGTLTAVFQWGWGADLIGLEQSVPVSAWVPILIFAILFGLSMDYEVFLLSRIREHWLASGDARGSVVQGLADTGRVISAAAAIMVAVFLGFATESDTVVKQIGLGMAVAVFLDATVVRMVLVPSTMALLGRWNWWLPGWLDRVLPRIDAELPHPAPRPAQPPVGQVAGPDPVGTSTVPPSDERPLVDA